MGLSYEHEIHKRRLGRNVGLGAVLLSFAALVFALTVAKVSDGQSMEAFDHSIRNSLIEASE